MRVISVFDIFTNDSAKDAAAANAALYSQYGVQAGNLLSNMSDLYKTYGNTADAYATGYGADALGETNAGEANANAAYDRAISGYNAARDAGIGAINAGAGNAATNLKA